jgi:hypothetical protein
MSDGGGTARRLAERTLHSCLRGMLLAVTAVSCLPLFVFALISVVTSLPGSGWSSRRRCCSVTGRARPPPVARAQRLARVVHAAPGAVPVAPASPRLRIRLTAEVVLPSALMIRRTTTIRHGMAQKSPQTQRIPAPIC